MWIGWTGDTVATYVGLHRGVTTCDNATNIYLIEFHYDLPTGVSPMKWLAPWFERVLGNSKNTSAAAICVGVSAVLFIASIYLSGNQPTDADWSTFGAAVVSIGKLLGFGGIIGGNVAGLLAAKDETKR